MSRRSAVAVGLVLLALVLAGSTWALLRPRPDPALERRLVATGLTLYVPSLRGAEPARVRVEGERVVLRMERDGVYAWSVTLRPALGGDLCSQVDLLADATCEVSGGVLRSQLEEQAAVALVRGGTVLVIDGLVTEQDPRLLDEAVTALREAPRVDARDLATR